MAKLFTAVALPPPIQAFVADALAVTDAACRPKLVHRDDTHVTLVYLGEVDDAQRDALAATLTAVASHHAPFSLSIAGGGTFGDRAPRVLWLGVDGALDALRALQAELSRALAIADEHGAYRPHLTLARTRPKTGEPHFVTLAESFASLRSDPFAVSEVALFASPGNGQRYTIERWFPLTAPAT